MTSIRSLYDVDVEVVAEPLGDEASRRIVIRAAFWELVRPRDYTGPDADEQADADRKAVEQSFDNPTEAEFVEAKRYMAGMFGRLLAGLLDVDPAENFNRRDVVSISAHAAEFVDLTSRNPLLIALVCKAEDEQYWLGRVDELVQRIIAADDE